MRFVFVLILFMTACGGTVVNNSANNASTTMNSPVRNPSAASSTLSVTMDSPDGVKLIGTFLEAPKSGSPGLLFLHQWQSDRHSYDEFAKRMQSKGFAILSIDGRGFGESTKKADGTAVTAGRGLADVQAMLGDVGAAIEYLKKQKNVDATRIGIVGASYGSSLAIMYAADYPEIRTVVLLSPGLNYFGNMPTRPAVEKYGDRDLFIVAAKGDEESAKAVDGLMVGRPSHGFMVLPAGQSHGTEMFKYRDKPDGPPIVEDAVESFLMTRMGLAPDDYK